MPPRARYQPTPPSRDPLLTPHEVACTLRCSIRTLQRYVAKGLLPAPIRITSQKCFWRKSVIRAFLRSRGAGERRSAS
jgi:predicted DNA-binding transcriptional regulator AlpA